MTLDTFRLDGTTLTATERRVNDAGATSEVSHDFDLTEPLDGEPRYSCHVDPAPAG